MYYQTRVRNDKPFPLPAGYFEQLRLSDERLLQLREEADKALLKTLAQCRTYQAHRESYLLDDAAWRLHADHEGLVEYKRPHKTHATMTVSQLFGKVDGNYRDLVNFFRSETKDQYLAVQKKVFNFTIDADVLLTIPSTSTATTATTAAMAPSPSPCAYEGIKWVAYEPFSLRFRMDSCHYETTGTGVDPVNGQPFAYRIILPVVLREVPDLFKAKRTVRIYAKSVLLMLPAQRNRSSQKSELFMAMENDFKCNHVPRSFYKRFMMNLHKIRSFMDAQRITTQSTLAAPTVWVAENLRTCCAVCDKPFSMVLLRGKHNCFMCGEVVCRKCLVKSSNSSDIASASAASQKLCTPCVTLLRDDYAHALTTPMGCGGAAAGQWTNSTGTSAKSPYDLRMQDHSRYSETPTEATTSDFSTTASSSSSVSRSGSSSVGYNNYYSSSATTRTGGYPHHTSNQSSRRNSSREGEWSSTTTTTPLSWSRTSTKSAESSGKRGRKSYGGGGGGGYDTEPLRYSEASTDGSSQMSSSPVQIGDEEDEDDVDTILEEPASELLLSQRSVVFTVDTHDMTPVRRSPPTTSAFQAIDRSLQEQEALLRELQLHASRVRTA